MEATFQHATSDYIGKGRGEQYFSLSKSVIFGIAIHGIITI